MINRETDYAIRVMRYMCARPDTVVSATVLAEALKIPYVFLRRINRALSDAGYLESLRGSGGGVRLKIDPEQTSLYDLINAFDDRALLLNACCRETDRCSFKPGCPVHDKLESLQRQLIDGIRSVPLSSLALTEE